MPELIKVLKRNPAGEVIWQYEGAVLQRETNALTLEASFNRADMPFMNIVLKQGDRFIETFYADRWYNVFAIYDREDGLLKGWYCNIAKPAVIGAESVSYVDLALDLWVAPDGTQTVLDEDELEALELDAETRERAYAALKALQQEFKNQRPPQ
ncbi:MAG TPA: DUF402 domain-containing protein [Anaerolineales bacterium]